MKNDFPFCFLIAQNSKGNDDLQSPERHVINVSLLRRGLLCLVMRLGRKKKRKRAWHEVFVALLTSSRGMTAPQLLGQFNGFLLHLRS